MWSDSDRIYSTSIDTESVRHDAVLSNITHIIHVKHSLFQIYCHENDNSAYPIICFRIGISIHRNNHIFCTHLCCCFLSCLPLAHLGHRVLLCFVPSVCPSVSLSVHPSRLCYHYTAHNISWILFTCGSAIGINMRMNPNDGFLC